MQRVQPPVKRVKPKLRPVFQVRKQLRAEIRRLPKLKKDRRHLNADVRQQRQLPKKPKDTPKVVKPPHPLRQHRNRLPKGKGPAPPLRRLKQFDGKVGKRKLNVQKRNPNPPEVPNQPQNGQNHPPKLKRAVAIRRPFP